MKEGRLQKPDPSWFLQSPPQGSGCRARAHTARGGQGHGLGAPAHDGLLLAPAGSLVNKDMGPVPCHSSELAPFPLPPCL